MKKDIRNRIYLLPLLAFIVILSACKKDEVPPVPVITTNDVFDITPNSVSCGGNITSEVDSTITARGVCWSKGKSPTIADSITSDGAGAGSFTSVIRGLSGSTTYYIRAYATNSFGTGYGLTKSFTTLIPQVPLIHTIPINSVTVNSAESGGRISDDRGSSVTEKGVCWSTMHNPTISDSKTIDGFDIGDFTSSIEELKPNTSYYIRAYAINSAGVGYGGENICKTFTDSVSDIDGNTYYTVTIGEQVWMAENLKTTKYNDGSQIPQATDLTGWRRISTPLYCWYKYDMATYKNLYGALYNLSAVKTEKLCPSGWHVPTDDEWKTLEIFLGMPLDQLDRIGVRGTDQGTQLKKPSEWSLESEILNSSGFSGMNGGYCNMDGSTYGGRDEGYWWSSTTINSGAWFRSISLSPLIKREASLNYYGFSVRCIKD